jgi:acyl-coenzyme A synthetase/AMP-(fatty) acid ligase
VSFTEFIAGHPAREPEVEIHADDIWEILFTSGTTALPKGVMISHACSYAAGFGFALSLTRGLQLESDLKVGTYLPLIYHVGDQPFTYSVFLCGGTLVLGRRPNPEHIAEMIAAERVTALWAGSPAMIRALDAALTARPDLDARSLTVIVYGWAALPPATLASMKRHCGEDLIKHCRASLAGYETPKSVVFAADLPETVGGKVLKYKLRAEHAGLYRGIAP